MEALDQLGKKLDAMLRQYAVIEAENKRLKETVSEQSKTVEVLTKKLTSLEHGMVSVRLGNTTDNEEEKENMRRQLDNVIAEIDKILNTLND